MKISIIGSGYVGLVSGACFAELGNQVVCADNNAQKVASLKQGRVPIYEPGLEELIRHNLRRKRLRFTSNIQDAVDASGVIFIAVGTPSLESGEADLTGIEHVARMIARHMDGYRLIVEKSTVPVETGEWVRHTIQTYLRRKVTFDVASNPEFLREGSAINDFMHPDRIVLGVESKKARDLLAALYKPLKAPLVMTDIKSAELIKHASNSFLATKISFINAVARICDIVGADVLEVAEGMGLDTRIGRSFLSPGIGYGGSCFPKDLDAFINISEKLGYEFGLLKAVKAINEAQVEFVLGKLKDHLWIIKGKTIAVLGLSFKPNTDDIRNAPAVTLITRLQAEGAAIRAYDPEAVAKAKTVLSKVTFCRDAYHACQGADCLLLVTDWDEFKELDFLRLKRLLKRPLVVDGRNIYDPGMLQRLGISYVGMGRRKR